jgi:UDP:flavonoid glycosyltransferase YjiC (YdhE family)
MVEGGGHVVVFPFPASGHIAPFVPFARCIASHGVAITFLYPKHEYARVRELESFDARENVELVAFDVPLAGGLSFSSFDALKYFMYDNVAQFDAIVAQFMDRPRTIQYPTPCDAGPPVCIVSDMFLGFTQ